MSHDQQEYLMVIPKRWDCGGKMNGSSLVGTVLARRYKILETIAVGSFKAHDLALDQTVTVREVLLTSQRAGDTWYQKFQQFALVRDPNFLNVLDVISDKSSFFVITERPRGHSIADLLRERSRLELRDVLRLLTPLAGALDLAAAFNCCRNPISVCWLFTETRNSFAVDDEQRSLSDEPPFLVKLDVWELVRPRKNKTWPFLTSKAQNDGSGGLAVRQAALLTYELLGGEKTQEDKLKHWFKPVNGLGDAGNSILYRGLQGSPRFESSGCFFQTLKSTIQSGDRVPRALPAPAPQARANSVTLSGTNDNTIKRFNRDTAWLATGVLGTVVFAAVVLAFQELHPRKVNPTEGGVQAGSDTSSARLFKDAGLSEKRSTGEITSGKATSVDHAFNKTSPQENSSSQTEAPASTPTPVLAFTSEINQDAQSNAGSWTPAHRQDSGRVIGPRVPRASSKSSVRPRIVDVKRRLIELWHQSLTKSEKSRNWTAFSNLNRGERKKAAYTAETNH